MRVNLAKFKQRLNTATAWPWSWVQHEDRSWSVKDRDGRDVCDANMTRLDGRAIGEFISEAPQDIAALIVEVERLMGELALENQLHREAVGKVVRLEGEAGKLRVQVKRLEGIVDEVKMLDLDPIKARLLLGGYSDIELEVYAPADLEALVAEVERLRAAIKKHKRIVPQAFIYRWFFGFGFDPPLVDAELWSVIDD